MEWQSCWGVGWFSVKTKAPAHYLNVIFIYRLRLALQFNCGIEKAIFDYSNSHKYAKKQCSYTKAAEDIWHVEACKISNQFNSTFQRKANAKLHIKYTFYKNKVLVLFNLVQFLFQYALLSNG